MGGGPGAGCHGRDDPGLRHGNLKGPPYDCVVSSLSGGGTLSKDTTGTFGEFNSTTLNGGPIEIQFSHALFGTLTCNYTMYAGGTWSPAED